MVAQAVTPNPRGRKELKVTFNYIVTMRPSPKQNKTPRPDISDIKKIQSALCPHTCRCDYEKRSEKKNVPILNKPRLFFLLP